MINVCLIGYGNWGKKVHKSLKKIKNIKQIQIIKSRRSKNKILIKNLNWVLVTTNTKNHYSLVKKILNKKINVFCEKPLTNCIYKDLILYNLAKKNNCKLYVSDIETYKKKRIKIYKNNLIVRSKFSNIKKEIVQKLVYHDFTYLFKHIKNKNPKSLKIIKNNSGELHFSLKLDKNRFLFKYSLNSKIKNHKFNKINLIIKKNVLKEMLSKVLNDKVDYNLNKKIALFSNKISNLVNSKLS